MGQLYATVEIDDAQVGTQIPVSLVVEVELRRSAPAANLGVVVLILAHRGGLVRDVRSAHEHSGELSVYLFALCGSGGKLLVDEANLLLGSLSLVLLALAHELADFLRHAIALGLQ